MLKISTENHLVLRLVLVYNRTDLTADKLMYVFTQPLHYDTKSIFKQSTVGFEFRGFLLLEC